MPIDPKSFLVGVVMGFMLSFLSVTLFRKNDLSQEKKVAFVIFTIWMTMLIYAFSIDRELPMLFDVIGFGSAGNLIGMNAFDLIEDKILRRKK